MQEEMCTQINKMGVRFKNVWFAILFVVAVLIVLLFLFYSTGMHPSYTRFKPDDNNKFSLMSPMKIKPEHTGISDSPSAVDPINTENKVIYNSSIPLIFIGGMPRSGTTLMRALLDAHPAIRCGEETRIIPNLLFMRGRLESSRAEKRRLKDAGIDSDMLDRVFRNMILQIIVEHGSLAQYFCNKDPFTHKFTIFLSYIYPNSKFILMIRDGRAVIHSVITRNVSISGFNPRNKTQCLRQWNQAIYGMYTQYVRVGPKRCLPVYYEQLVLNKVEWLHRIFEFLEIPWNDAVLHHEDYIEKPDGISISKSEFSTDQIKKPINTNALSTWVGFYNDRILERMHVIAPMLKTLGYDPENNNPDYSNPPDEVRFNTLHLTTNRYIWKGFHNIFDKSPYNNSLRVD